MNRIGIMKFLLVESIFKFRLFMLVMLCFAVSNNMLAQVETNDFEVDLESYKSKYHQAIEGNNQEDQASILEIIVKEYNSLSNWDSVYYYNRLLAKVQLEVGDKERFLNAYMVNMSIAGMFDKYDIDLEEANNTIYTYANDPVLHPFRRGEIYAVVGKYVFSNVNRDSAIVLLDRAIELSQHPEVEKQYLLSHQKQKAIYLNAMGRNDEAIAELMDIIRNEQFSLNSSYFRWGIMDELGDIFFDIRNYEKAELYYNKAMRIAQENSFEFSEAFSKGALAKVRISENRLEEAELLINQTVPVFLKKKKYLNVAIAFLDKATIRSKYFDYNSAQMLLDSTDYYLGTMISEQLYGNQSIVRGNANLLRTEIALNTDRIDEAKDMVNAIERDENFSSINNARVKLAYMRYQIAKEENRGDDALGYFEQYVLQRDSIEASSSRMRVNIIESEFNRQEQDNKIAVLDAVTVEQRKSLALRNKALIIGGLMLAFLAGLLIGLYKMYRKNKESQIKLEEQNIIIQKALAENKVLIKEIHHRVKNNLQVISSLLSLQERKVTDENTKEALRSSKTRVETMSILHQSLYQEDNVKGISVQQYFTQLVNNLIDTYTVNDSISTTVDIDDLKIDVDSLIPIGLVANELICNAIKHGVGDAEMGSIIVSLKEEGDQIILSVEDSGGKLNQNELTIKSGSLGVKLIKAFSNRLDGTIVVDSGDSTKVSLVINKANINFVNG